MDATYVLVHSPSVGPLTWAPVAARLDDVIVPSLVGVADAGPPFWRAVADTVGAAIDQLPAGRPVVLVAHSNAGLFVPAIVEASRRPVAACLFVDASLPALDPPTPVVSHDQMTFLHAIVDDDGRLPPWTSWFDEADVAPMFPDAATRAAVAAEEPRLPIAYYEEAVPAPAGWDDRACGYLLFGPPYEPVAKDAESRGWTVGELPGRHLHQLVDPAAVAAWIRDFRLD